MWAPLERADDLARRCALELHEMKRLAAADALMRLSGHRRRQVWDAATWQQARALLEEAAANDDVLELPKAARGRRDRLRLRGAGADVTLLRYPLVLQRDRLGA